jgi:hypothetical protein
LLPSPACSLVGQASACQSERSSDPILCALRALRDPPAQHLLSSSFSPRSSQRLRAAAIKTHPPAPLLPSPATIPACSLVGQALACQSERSSDPILCALRALRDPPARTHKCPSLYLLSSSFSLRLSPRLSVSATKTQPPSPLLPWDAKSCFERMRAAILHDLRVAVRPWVVHLRAPQLSNRAPPARHSIRARMAGMC